MFDKEFYPTPKALIEKMLEPYRYRNGKLSRFDDLKYSALKDLSILEPSAGKGDILDFIKDNADRYAGIKIHAIEKNHELQSILKDKEYPVVADDFLSYNDSYFYDLIIMNPPFSNGDEHLLKAVEIATETEIICLLNAETIRNPYTKRRKLLLEKIDQYGSYEFLKDEFTQAERRTGVEVAIVRLSVKKENQSFDFNFGDFDESDLNFDFDVQNNQVARQDLIGNMNLRYEEVREHYKEFLRAEAKYKHFRDLFMKGEQIFYKNNIELESGEPKQKYNHLSQNLKTFMWRKVIKRLDIEKYMSHKVKTNFEAYIKQQTNMAFTKENVASFFQTIMNNRVNIWDQAVVDVFEMLTDYYKDNRNHIEGWRTNDRYKINRKIILPNWCEWQTSYMSDSNIKSYGAEFKVDYRHKDKYNDIDKVLDFLSGRETTHDYTINDTLERHFENIGRVRQGEKFQNTCESRYFKIKFFKKGTVHLEFKDKKLWDLFNMTACAAKNWLPDNERTKWEEAKKKRREAPKNKPTALIEEPTLF